MELVRYSSDMAEQWNAFIERAVNGVFLFNRGFMDYHADRFEDYSLIVRDDDEWIAVLPGNKQGNEWCSHSGLSYGGLIYQQGLGQTRVNKCLALVIDLLKQDAFQSMILKLVPDIYYKVSDQSLAYAVFQSGFHLFRRDAATTIVLSERKKIKKGRKACISKARRIGVEVTCSNDFNAFMELENANLQKKYGVNAVHTADELVLLYSRFPDNIRLFLAHIDGVLVAGGIIFQSSKVMHLQYFGANEQGEEISAGDLIIDAMILHCSEQGLDIFDFGISTEQQGRYLNEGLLRYKESFGATTTTADFYKKNLYE